MPFARSSPTTDASIMCFQEAKMELIRRSIVLETFGSKFEDYVYLPTAGTRGGILVAWRSEEVAISDPVFTTNALSAKVRTSTTTATPWWITIVYGSQEDADKIPFLQELRDIHAECVGPWMLCWDFNLIYKDNDKSNGNLDRCMMGRFRQVLNNLSDILKHK
jgi:hypothetical protein